MSICSTPSKFSNLLGSVSWSKNGYSPLLPAPRRPCHHLYLDLHTPNCVIRYFSPLQANHELIHTRISHRFMDYFNVQYYSLRNRDNVLCSKHSFGDSVCVFAVEPAGALYTSAVAQARLFYRHLTDAQLLSTEPRNLLIYFNFSILREISNFFHLNFSVLDSLTIFFTPELSSMLRIWLS